MFLQGAAFTFDVEKYTTFVLSLRQTPMAPAVAFRTFSHAKKDPEPGAFLITPMHRIVVIEGLYVLLDEGGWRDSVNALDQLVWVECPREVARRRLIARHLKEGVEITLCAAEQRGTAR